MTTTLTLTRLRAAAAAIVAAVLVATAVIAAPAAHAAVPALWNANFAEVGSDGVPVGWSTWRPAGTATVTVDPAAGPTGGPAVAIASTSGATARLALSQRVAVTDATPRRLLLTAQVRGEGLSGYSMLRVQAHDAAGRVVVPVKQGPYLTGTFDWRAYEVAIELPLSATRLTVEPMLDRSPGTAWFADLELREQTESGSLDALASPSGPVELHWQLEADGVDRYAVHRAEGTAAPALGASSLIRHAEAATTADDTAAPGSTYTYVVRGLAADGTVLATTPPATAHTPAAFADRTLVSVLSALQVDDGAHVSWAVAAGAADANLSIAVGDRSAVPVQGYEGSIELAGAAGDEVVLRAGATELASAVVGDRAHPRTLVDDAAFERVHRLLDEGAPTTTGAWNALLARLAAPATSYRTSAAELYQARDAAFAFAITGDAAYAQQAYDAVLAGEYYVMERPSNMGLELGRAMLNLAPAYDLAHEGWSDAQRASVRAVMTRAVDLLATYHHENLDSDDKASNWIGVVRSTELALLLAARGDGDFGMHDQRIAFLVDQLDRHLQEGYTSTGYSQEGWDYLHYTQLYMLPSIFMAQDSGLRTLDASLAAPDFSNLALHAVSSRSAGDTLQYGASGPNGQVGGTFPLLFPTAPTDALPGLVHLYDRLHGIHAARPDFDGLHSMWPLLYYPEQVGGDVADLAAPEAYTALMDEEAGFFAFRNRYQDADDTLIATSGRNAQHNGWAAAETFSLSWMSHDTTWALLGGKSSTQPLLWSKPLVDGQLEPYANQYHTVRGEGRTLGAHAFEGQGGGYLHLDGAANFEVATAEREQVVDLSTDGEADAIVAIRDMFGDDVSHSWDWQLRPQGDVAIATFPGSAEHEPLFTFTSPGGEALSGFVLDRDGLETQVIDHTLRLSRTGTDAEFRIVLVTSAAGPLTAELVDGDLVVDDRVVDFDALAATGDGLPRLLADDGATSTPARAALSSDNGWDTGLRDGDYTVTMNLWWGANATLVRLYEDGELVGVQRLEPGSPQAQHAAFPIEGRADGTYEYVAELVNSAGATRTTPLRVEVEDASPGVPVLSHDNRDRDGDFTVTADLWWGTNATAYRFYLGDALIAEGELVAATPGAQRATVAQSGLTAGTHVFRVEFINDAGATSSRAMSVTVR